MIGFSVVVMAGAAMLVAPSPSDTPVPQPAEAVESAVALLGDIWQSATPRDASPEAARTAAPAETVRALRRLTAPEAPEAAGGDAHRADLPAPLRRPAGLSGPVAQLDTTEARPTGVARANQPETTEALRWVVRDRTTGAVLAEVPLSEALALLQARSLR
jgi:hypothetical protein